MRALILPLLLCACTPQVATYPGPMREVWAEKTWVAVEDSAQGFLITVEYNADFGSAVAAATAACKSALLAQASAYVGSRGRQIQPINEQRITMSVGCRGLAPSCLAQVPVEWQWY